jgi:hypothetical protein
MEMFCAKILAIYWQYIGNTEYWQYIGARVGNILLHNSNLAITRQPRGFGDQLAQQWMEDKEICRMVTFSTWRVYFSRI